MRFSRLFRPAPPTPPAPEDPVAALDSRSPELIAATALGDGDEALRAAAIRKLQDREVLRKLAGLSEGPSPPIPASIELIAQERMAQLIDAGAIDFAEVCAAAPGNSSAVLSVAGLCTDSAHLSHALDLIDVGYARARVAAAPASPS